MEEKWVYFDANRMSKAEDVTVSHMKAEVLLSLGMNDYQQYISLNPNIRFGKPCINGTRIAVQDILSWLASGMTNDEILDDFPELTLEHIRAALALI